MHKFQEVFVRRARAELVCIQESEGVGLGELDACVDVPGFRILKSAVYGCVCSFVADELYLKLVREICVSKHWQIMVFEYGTADLPVRTVVVNMHLPDRSKGILFEKVLQEVTSSLDALWCE